MMTRSAGYLPAAALALTALAGFVDAVALSSLGGLFASAVDANVVRIGTALVWGDGATFRTGIALLLGFVAGAIGGQVLLRAAPVRGPALAVLLAALLALAGWAAARLPLLIGDGGASGIGGWAGMFGGVTMPALAAAMGAVHLVLRSTPALDVAPGTALIGLARGLADRLLGLAPPAGHDMGIYGPALLGFGAGVVLGARRFGAQGLDAVAEASAAALLIGLLLLAAPSRRPSSHPA
ncbi:DUF1275 domain-containing protein [Sphingomonas changnyeongensis]|uniref:DUF1275 domain-containing protein n=1 Tax=Sphingomonas changnyeongensis TaxID=2698679 RepID=A0A7Z2NWR6_9SPHN|nr:DUF1275 family protein [Sphingomonas changnyeongensis]QHL90775.1 DUF1275 domain-containing protein [Sphingomonas changnyeongensis]